MSKRVLKINELVKEEISQILFEEIGTDLGFFTVLAVDTTRDLRHSIVWLSYIGENQEALLEELERRGKVIQKNLNRRLVLKYVPKLTYRIDYSGEYAAELEKTFKKIKHDQE